MMHVTKLEVRNVKGVEYAEIIPNKTTTVIGGSNAAGKSSLMDSIAYAVGGRKLCPKEPIKRGKDKAEVKLKLSGDESSLLPPCTVIRRWERNGSKTTSELEIVTEDGFSAPSPQTLLNDLLEGQVAFDPEAFLRFDPKKQAQVLRELVGLDTSDLDAEYAQKYAERTDVNRQGKEAKARLDAISVPEGTPDEEVSVASLMEELTRRENHNQANEAIRGKVDTVKQKVKSSEKQIADCEEQLRQLQDTLQALQNDRAAALKKLDRVSCVADELEDQDVKEVRDQISQADEVNRHVRAKKERDELDASVIVLREHSKVLTSQLKSLETEKAKRQSEAKWPVEGLGFSDAGVTYNDLPLEQVSASEQRRVAIGISCAMSPRLKCALIRDGSLLDDRAMADMAEHAARAGVQLFIERVGEGSECHVLLKDGVAEVVDG